MALGLLGMANHRLLTQHKVCDAVVSRFPLDPPIQPGSLSAGPDVCTTQVAIVGKHVAILASPGGHARATIDAASIYLVDPATKKIRFTSKKSMGTEPVAEPSLLAVQGWRYSVD